MSDYRTQGSADKLRRYYVGGTGPNGTGWGWGIFVIADDGYFSAITDFGGYVYFWGHANRPIREFLISCESDYVERKMMESRRMEPNTEGTKRAVKGHLIEARRNGGWPKDRTRKEWDRLSLLDDSVHEWMQETRLDDAYEFISEKPPANVHAFAYELFPRFQAALQAELAAEATAVAVST